MQNIMKLQMVWNCRSSLSSAKFYVFHYMRGAFRIPIQLIHGRCESQSHFSVLVSLSFITMLNKIKSNESSKYRTNCSVAEEVDNQVSDINLSKEFFSLSCSFAAICFSFYLLHFVFHVSP